MFIRPELQVFHYLDIDQTGLIKPHELFRHGLCNGFQGNWHMKSHAIPPLAVTVTPRCRVLGCNDTVKNVLDAADADGDSVINEEEFRVVAQPHTCKKRSHTHTHTR